MGPKLRLIPHWAPACTSQNCKLRLSSAHAPQTDRTTARCCARLCERHARLPAGGERDQARRDRSPSAARAQAALHRQASAFRGERDVSADEGSRLTRINRIGHRTVMCMLLVARLTPKATGAAFAKK